MLLHDLVLHKCDSHGARPALLRGDECLSYAELQSQIRKISDGLRNLGICRGDRIAIYLGKRFEGVIAFFAVSDAGAIFVPVNPVLKPAQVAHILNDCAVA